MNKYRNKKVTVEGITFDSLHEARRYCELKMLAMAGHIKDLELQKPFELIPAQYEEVKLGGYYTKGERKGQPRTKRVCVEKAVIYKADFCYTENGRLVVEDAKGFKTKEYILKRKLMLWLKGIKIREV